jgi:hypothetical protein
MSADLRKFPFTDTWISTNWQRCTVASLVISCNQIRLPDTVLTVNGMATNQFVSLICTPIIRWMMAHSEPNHTMCFMTYPLKRVHKQAQYHTMDWLQAIWFSG